MDKKLLFISGDTKKELSFDEVFKKYQPLIKAEIRSWTRNYECDDLYQLASIALWRAYTKYSTDKSHVAFGYYARAVIRNSLFHHERDNKKHRIATITSLNDTFKTSVDGDIEIIDTLADGTDYENKALANIALSACINKLKEKDRVLITEIARGLTQEQIASKHGISQCTVSRHIVSARKKLQKVLV